MYTTPSLDPSDTNDIYKYVMELIPQTDDLQVFLQKVYLICQLLLRTLLSD